MVIRIFNDPVAWGILATIGLLAFLTALIFKNNFKKRADVKDPSIGDGALRGLEAFLLAIIGGLLARAAVSVLLGAANDTPAAGVVIGWGFFLFPGLIGTIPYLTHSHALLTSVNDLLIFATVVGGFTGALNGLWKIYSWTGLGWIAFPLDVTWGLAGNTIACLLHIINFAWAGHGDEDRENAHRYASGFCLKPGYAFTQGCVMSALSEAPGDPLYNHEITHVWQNRIFGPAYTLTYLGWMAVWVVPSLIYAAIKLGFSEIFSGPQAWCYFNNPWEAWAYEVQSADRRNIQGVTAGVAKLIWSGVWVVIWAVVFYLGTGVLGALTLKSVWIDKPAEVTATHPSGAKSAPPKTKPRPVGTSPVPH